MWLMLQQDEPDDYVVATGVSHSVRELVEFACEHVGLDWKACVRQDPKLLRPAEVDHLIGDRSKARQKLGWAPDVDFPALVKMMVDADMRRLSGTRSPANAHSLVGPLRRRSATSSNRSVRLRAVGPRDSSGALRAAPIASNNRRRAHLIDGEAHAAKRDPEPPAFLQQFSQAAPARCRGC